MQLSVQSRSSRVEPPLTEVVENKSAKPVILRVAETSQLTAQKHADTSGICRGPAGRAMQVGHLDPLGETSCRFRGGKQRTDATVSWRG